MKIAFSPSKTKTLCGMPSKGSFRSSTTEYISQHMTKLTVPQIAQVLKINEDKAGGVLEFFKDFSNQPVGNSCESYDGIAFKYLDWKGLDDEAQAFGDIRIVVLSGLYGIVEPNSPVTDYRLDIADRIGKVLPFEEILDVVTTLDDEVAPSGVSAATSTNTVNTVNTLYELWQPAVDAYFHQEDWILNLASKEYVKMIRHPRIVTIEFWECKKNVWKQMSTSSKMMRGTMGHYILANQVEELKDLPKELDGFILATDVQGVTVPTESMTIRYERVTE